MRLVLFSLLSVLFCACGPHLSKADPPPATGGPDVFEPHPDAASFCSGHVSGAPTAEGPGAHITWDAYATSLELDAVLEHYRNAYGVEEKVVPEQDPKHTMHLWRSPSAQKPSRVLRVSDAAADGPWKHECDVPEGTRTVFVLSSMAR